MKFWETARLCWDSFEPLKWFSRQEGNFGYWREHGGHDHSCVHGDIDMYLSVTPIFFGGTINLYRYNVLVTVDNR